MTEINEQAADITVNNEEEKKRREELIEKLIDKNFGNHGSGINTHWDYDDGGDDGGCGCTTT